MANKKWTIEEKTKIVREFIDGESVTSLSIKYNVKSRGMIANWKKEYIANGNKFVNKTKGRKKINFDEIEVLKKSYALLMKIRSKQQ